MAEAKDYNVTTGYGCLPNYPLNYCKTVNGVRYGFHRGQDRIMSVATEVKVNGVTIGLSGGAKGAYGSGASTGPHLHIGRWIGGTVTNPNGAGFTLSNPKVVSTEPNHPTNGGTVRLLDSDGVTWIYLHLSKILVAAGQEIGVEDMFEGKTAEQWANEARPTVKDVNGYFTTYLGYKPTAAQIAGYTKQPWQVMMDDVCLTQKNMGLATPQLIELGAAAKKYAAS